MVISLIELIPEKGRRKDALDILTSVVSLTRLKSGCMSANVYERRAGDRPILHIEEWRSREDLYEHIRSEVYFRVLVAIELAFKMPKIEFYEAHKSTDKELISRLRRPFEESNQKRGSVRSSNRRTNSRNAK